MAEIWAGNAEKPLELCSRGFRYVGLLGLGQVGAFFADTDLPTIGNGVPVGCGRRLRRSRRGRGRRLRRSLVAALFVRQAVQTLLKHLGFTLGEANRGNPVAGVFGKRAELFKFCNVGIGGQVLAKQEPVDRDLLGQANRLRKPVGFRFVGNGSRSRFLRNLAD